MWSGVRHLFWGFSISYLIWIYFLFKLLPPPPLPPALHCSGKEPLRSLHQEKEVANATYLLLRRNFLQQFSLPGTQYQLGIHLACNLPDLTEMTHWDWAVYIKTSMQYHIGLQFAWPNSLLPDAQGNWRSDSNRCFLKTCKVDLVILHSTLPLICCISLTRLYLYHLSIKITLDQDTQDTQDLQSSPCHTSLRSLIYRLFNYFNYFNYFHWHT